MFSMLETIWGPIEPIVFLIGLVVAIYFFVADRPRRLTLVGFIPTVITLVFDKFEHQVLIAKIRATEGSREIWILPQGRISGDLQTSGAEVLRNELGIERGVTFFDTTFLGAFPLKATYRLNRYKGPREFRLWPCWRGKGYFGLPIDLPTAAVKSQLVVDHYAAVELVTVCEARKRLNASHANGKLNMYLRMLAELEQNNFYLETTE